MENNNEYKDATITAVGEDGNVVSLSEEMMDREKFDDINVQLISETDPEKRKELEAKADALAEKLGLEVEHKMAA